MSNATMHENGGGDGNDDKREGRARTKPDPKASSSSNSKDPDNKKASLDGLKSSDRGKKRNASSPAAPRPSTRRGRGPNQSYTKQGDGFFSYSPVKPASESVQTPVSQPDSTARRGRNAKFSRHGDGFLSYVPALSAEPAEPASESPQLPVSNRIQRHIINRNPEIRVTKEHTMFEEEEEEEEMMPRPRISVPRHTMMFEEEDEEEMMPRPTISEAMQYSQSPVGASTRPNMMGGAFTDDSMASGSPMSDVDIGAPSLSITMAAGGMTGHQAGAAPAQMQGVIKTKKELDVDKAFVDVLGGYNDYSTLNVGRDGLNARLRKTALDLFTAVVTLDMKEEGA